MKVPLLELSISDLLQSTNKAFPNTTARQHNTDSVSVTDCTLVPAQEALIATGTVRGSSGKPYSVAVEFNPVTYNPPEGEPQVTFVADSKEYTIAPISKQRVDCSVSCQCLDFAYRFAQYNDASNSLYGPKPKLYARQINSNRPPANPTHSPGLCKHLIDFINELVDSGIVQ